MKLLGMLGSDFEGERANAAAMIAKLAKAEGKTIADLVMTGGETIIYRDRIVEKTVYRDRPAEKTPDDLRNYRPEHKRKKASRYDAAGALAGLRWARDFEEHLSGWEMDFIEDILRKTQSDYDLTYQQVAAAWRIINKVRKIEGESLV